MMNANFHFATLRYLLVMYTVTYVSLLPEEQIKLVLNVFKNNQTWNLLVTSTKSMKGLKKFFRGLSL